MLIIIDDGALPDCAGFGACRSGKAIVCFLPPPFARVISAREGDFVPLLNEPKESEGMRGLRPGLLVESQKGEDVNEVKDDRRRGEADGDPK
jgi:hypothetical protein